MAELNAAQKRLLDLARQREASDMRQKSAMSAFAPAGQQVQMEPVQAPQIAPETQFSPFGEMMPPMGMDLTDPAKERLALQGMSLGTADEIEAAARALGGEDYGQALSAIRSDIERRRQENPVLTGAQEIAGALASPANIPRIPIMAGRPALEATTRSGVAGGVYGFATGEDGFEERLESAGEVAVPAALFGLAAEKVVLPAASSAARVFGKDNKAPTLEELRAAKNEAYASVDSKQTVFNPNDIEVFSNRARSVINELDYIDEADPAVRAVLQMIDKRKGQDMTLGQMDSFRQALYRRKAGSRDDEKLMIQNVIDEMDELVVNKMGTDESLKTARFLNSQYKKAETLENAIEAAKTQAAATGSGGNVENLFRQSVNRILKNPKQMRFFSPSEREAMEQFVRGDLTQNTLRQIGKLSPTGNGLMMALNLGAVAYNPAMIAATVAGVGAKALADSRVRSEAQRVVDLMKGVPMGGRELRGQALAAPSAVVPSLLDAGE